MALIRASCSLVVLLLLLSGGVGAQDSNAPFCFPTPGTLGYRFEEPLPGSVHTHTGVDIWTGQEPSDALPPGNPIFLPYSGRLVAFKCDDVDGNGTSDCPPTGTGVVQGFKFFHPDLGIYTEYFHMADESTGESYVNPKLALGETLPKGTFLGYQGNRRWCRLSGCYESAITHLHIQTKDSAENLIDPSVYLGYQLDVNKPNVLSKGFAFFNTCRSSILSGKWGVDGKDLPGFHGQDASGKYAPTAFTFCMALDQNGQCIQKSSSSFGWYTDFPIVGDWNNDGINDIGIFRPWGGDSPADSQATTFHLNINGQVYKISLPGFFPQDIPLVGDWDGQNGEDLGTYDPITSTFYLLVFYQFKQLTGAATPWFL